MSDTLKHLDASPSDPQAMLFNLATSVLNFICSPEQVEVRRLMIAEAARSGTGKLLFDKITALRSQISSFLAACMASGLLRQDDPDLAADHLGALLEAEILGPLLLLVREASPNEEETALAARRAGAAFLRAYARTAPPTKDHAGHNAHLLRLPPHEL
jgi:AcrR family transcriptional regulator